MPPHHPPPSAGENLLPAAPGCRGWLDPGIAGAEAGEGAARKPPHREPLTLPCISSRMVRVTFRPPSETFDSISYRGTGDVC